MASLRIAACSRGTALSASTRPSATRVNVSQYLANARRFTSTQPIAKKEGDISSVFRSLSNGPDEALPARYIDAKKRLLTNKDELYASWIRLLNRLKEETSIIREQGSKLIPEIEFSNI